MERTRQHELLTDVAVVLATAAWPLLLWQEQRAGSYTWSTGAVLAIEVVATLVALGLLGWRRRYPVAVAVAIVPLSLSALVVVPAYVALYTVAARRDRRTAITVAAGHLAASLVGQALFDPPDAWLPRTLMLAAFTAVPVALGMVRQARTALLQELEDRAVRAESEQQLRVDRARRVERQRIAREMHDVVAHRISLVSLHAGGLAYGPDIPPHEVARAAEVIRSSAHDALEELRGAIGVLREDAETAEPERPQPTLADVPDLFARCREAGMKLLVHDQLGGEAVPAVAARTAYRVLEEALTNAAKHAPQATVEATIATHPNGLVVEVVNALPLSLRGPRAGTATIPGAGAGLIGLAERVSLASGRLEHGPTPEGRFRTRAEIPWTS